MSRTLAAFLVAGVACGLHLQPPELEDPDKEAGLVPAEEAREAEAVKRYKLLIGTHHKTGTTLAAASKGGITRVLGHRTEVNYHWGRIWCPTCKAPPANLDGVPRGWRVAHLVRNPVSAVISGYLYHRDVSGVLKNTDYGAARAQAFVTHPALKQRIKGHETYSSFLRHVSLRDGLHTELDRFFRQEHDEWAASFAQCSTHHKGCRHVCLEEFARDYNGTWKKIVEFAGYNVDEHHPGLMDELSKHDVRLHPSMHVTSGSVTATERTKMAAEVRDIDGLVYNGKLAALPRELYACGRSEGEERSSIVEIEDALDAWA